jgi:hypothetical protein
MIGRWLPASMLLLLAPAPALAQKLPDEVTGSRIHIPPSKMAPKDTRQITATFGDCVVNKHRVEAEQFVAADTRKEVDALIPQVFDDECLSNEADARNGDIRLALPRDIAKFAIADALVRRQIANIDPATLSKAPRLTYVAPELASFLPQTNKTPTAKQMAAAEEAFKKAEVDVAFEVYGDCVVRENPAAAKQLLTSPVASAYEAAAFGALMPAFSGCLPKNQQFTATKSMLRGTVALAYYRLANVSKGLSASAAK